MKRQISYNTDSSTAPSLLIQKLDEHYGPLIAKCQSASILAEKLKLKAELPITFPRIVVVGCESAGKSSIIERLAGFRFFPTGEGLTTRMPIAMTLKLTSQEACIELSIKHKLNFNPLGAAPIIGLRPLNSSTMQYYVDERAAELIQTEMTNYLSQANQGRAIGISETEFEIEILHWTVPNLNFVDLPGVVSAVRADEPKDLPLKTRNLAMRYIRDPNSLVIAVVPCMEYIVNNPIVGMIQEADAVKRTLCVLTKIDVTQPISCVISRVSGTAPDAEPFRAGFGYIGISNGGDNRVTDMSSITRIETGFCAPLKNSHPELNERLGLSCLVNALIRNFQVHLRQHVLSNLETAAKSMRKLALDYSDTLGTFIDESNYRQALHNYLLLQ